MPGREAGGAPIVQLMLDHAALPSELVLALRIGAPLAAICVSGGFFGVAFLPRFKALLYSGAALVSLVTGVGLLLG